MNELKRYLESIPMLIKINDNSKDEKYIKLVIEELNNIVIGEWMDKGGYELTVEDIRTAKRRAIAREKNNPN